MIVEEEAEGAVLRAEKENVIAGLHDIFAQASIVVVTHNNGLSVPEITDLRQRMRGAGAGFRVTKNTLARIALKGTPYGPLADMLRGPTAIAFSQDPVAAAKVAVEYARVNERLMLVGGAMGATVLDVEGVRAIATLPPIDELRARLVGLVRAPATRLAQLLQAPGGQVARALAAYAAREEAP
jgi:large subunit ribosomal protein L10